MNRIIGSVYVIDTGGLWLTSNSSSTGTYPDMLISNVGFYGADSNSEIALSYQSDTTCSVFHLKTQVGGGGYEDIHFATPHKVSARIFVNTVTVGTGYIYFS